MKRESVIIESFVIDKPKQVKIIEVRIPREVEKIIGVELGFNLLRGDSKPASPVISGLTSFAAVGDTRSPDASGIGEARGITPFKRSICIGEIRLQSFSKANLFYAGELVMDRNLDYGDFTAQFFPPQVYTHGAPSFETDVKLTAKHRLIRGVYRDQLVDSFGASVKYRVNLYLWTSKLEKALQP